MSEAALYQKARTESILEQITHNTPYVVVTKNAINTPVKKDGYSILDIYYRKAEIRININENSVQYTRYLTLREKGIAYQKATANPKGRNGIYAFFVSDENVRTALVYLLGI